MLNIQKTSLDRTGLGYVSSIFTPFTFETLNNNVIFVPPLVKEKNENNVPKGEEKIGVKNYKGRSVLGRLWGGRGSLLFRSTLRRSRNWQESLEFG